jgi:DNA-binding GntR family transcriptional regulator
MVLTPLVAAPQLNQRAYEAISEAILSGRFKPGQMLSIGRLADELGISRTPVRDALLQLQKEGLIKLVPFRSAFVTGISHRDVAEVYELRSLLHGYAARLAATRLTDQELDQAEAVLDGGVQARQVGDYGRALACGGEFHDLISSCVESSQMMGILAQLRAHRARLRFLLSEMHHRLERSDAEHREILAALRARDPETAERLMRVHLDYTKDQLLAELGSLCATVEPATGQ